MSSIKKRFTQALRSPKPTLNKDTVILDKNNLVGQVLVAADMIVVLDKLKLKVAQQNDDCQYAVNVFQILQQQQQKNVSISFRWC